MAFKLFCSFGVIGFLSIVAGLFTTMLGRFQIIPWITFTISVCGIAGCLLFMIWTSHG